MTKLEKTILEAIESCEKNYPNYIGKEEMISYIFGYCMTTMNEKVAKALKEKYFFYNSK